MATIQLKTQIPGPKSKALSERRSQAVPRGLSHATPIYVAKTEGAILEDVDGNRYIDFAGGIGCLNTGHRAPGVLTAIERQLDKFLHTCVQVTPYESYIRLAERLNQITPGNFPKKTLFVNSGAEAVENAVKIARAATGRPGIIAFEDAFHGRTYLTMAMTAKLVYKQGFGPLGTDTYRAPAPYPYRGVSTDDALRGLELLFAQDVDPGAVAAIVLEPVQGEGGFIPMPAEFVQALRRVCDEHGILYVDDEVQSGCGRTGAMWAIEQLGVEPDILVAGKTLGGGLPLASVTGRAEVMEAVHPGGLGGTFGGNPVACAAALAVLDELTATGFRERAEEVGALLRRRLGEIAARQPVVGEVRGLGAMLALELAEPTADAARATTTAALAKGLLLLSCGVYGNVIRLLPPLTATDEELERGLELLEEALGDAGVAPH